MVMTHIELITKERWKKLQNSSLTLYMVIIVALMIFQGIFYMKRRWNRYFMVSRDWLIGILASYTYRDIKSDFQAFVNILLYFYPNWKLLCLYGAPYIKSFFSANCEESSYLQFAILMSFLLYANNTVKICVFQEFSSHLF